MKNKWMILSAAGAVALTGLLALNSPARALSCMRQDFTQKVQRSKNIVVGEIVHVPKRYGAPHQIKIVKVLKNGGMFKPGQRTFSVSVNRMTSFGFKPRRGQLVLFFFYDNVPRWTCTGPILLR